MVFIVMLTISTILYAISGYLKAVILCFRLRGPPAQFFIGNILAINDKERKYIWAYHYHYHYSRIRRPNLLISNRIEISLKYLWFCKYLRKKWPSDWSVWDIKCTRQIQIDTAVQNTTWKFHQETRWMLRKCEWKWNEDYLLIFGWQEFARKTKNPIKKNKFLAPKNGQRKKAGQCNKSLMKASEQTSRVDLKWKNDSKNNKQKNANTQNAIDWSSLWRTDRKSETKQTV